MDPEYTGLLFPRIVQDLVWAILKPVAIRVLVREINFGVQQFLGQEAEEWAEFPIEMDRSFRNIHPGYIRQYVGEYAIKRPPPPWERCKGS